MQCTKRNCRGNVNVTPRNEGYKCVPHSDQNPHSFQPQSPDLTGALAGHMIVVGCHDCKQHGISIEALILPRVVG
ncbi:hypothetical protein XENTR_v10003532 [Xenopus tropicalis]|nr:hypothetical protein XENTR_v10003532 [Xenopus tropicalis]